MAYNFLFLNTNDGQYRVALVGVTDSLSPQAPGGVALFSTTTDTVAGTGEGGLVRCVAQLSHDVY